MNTTKRDLVLLTWQRSRLPQRDVERVIDKLLDLIPWAALEVAPVELRGFGTFEVRAKRSRPAHNFQTGESIRLPRRRVLRLRFSPQVIFAVKAGAILRAANVSFPPNPE